MVNIQFDGHTEIKLINDVFTYKGRNAYKSNINCWKLSSGTMSKGDIIKYYISFSSL